MTLTRPYLYYDAAVSICATCFQKVDAKIVFEDERVWMLKHCFEHGSQRVLVADDVDYYRQCREIFIKKARDASEAQHADQIRLPLRLWSLSRP